MITIGFCTRKIDSDYINHIKSKSRYDNEIIYIENNGEKSLTQCYNELLDKSSNDIVLLIHDDLILSKDFDAILYNHFINSDYGILGLAGTNELNESCVWWQKRELMVGCVWHENGGKPHKSEYSPENSIINEVAVIDGLFIGIHKKRIENRFNEKIPGFHFYDITFCLDNKNVKKGVIFLNRIIHKSVGNVNQAWHDNKKLVVEMYKDMLPYVVVPKIYIPETNRLTNHDDSVAIIIPSKNNFAYLKRCVDSIILHTKHTNYQIFYADTGSKQSDIDDFENDYKNVKVIRYNYYHFGKINNAVVRDYCQSYKYLLFCNDDIIFLNDIISEMLHVHNTLPKVGTTGARLYYENGRIQHGGIEFIPSNQMVNINHKGHITYHGCSLNNEKVVGNTAALLMIRRINFSKVKGFIEDNEDCFEDVILNLHMLDKNNKLNNIFVGSAVAYHTESVSRRRDPKIKEKLLRDYQKYLYPMIVKNYNIYKPYFNK